jgi:hypothetical protein
LWEFKDLGTFTGSYPAPNTNVTVAPHATIVLRMTKAADAAEATKLQCKTKEGVPEEPCLPGADACCNGPSGVGQACFSMESQECCTTGFGKGHVCPKGKCSTRAGFICD